MKRHLKILAMAIVAVFLVVGSAWALPFNTRPIYTSGTTLDSLQGVFNGIGSTIDVRADQSGAAIFTNQSTGTNTSYVASLSWNATDYPFEFGIYEYGNITNQVAVFKDATDATGNPSVADPGDYTTINFNKIGGMITTWYTDADSGDTVQLDSTNDWMDAFGFYFSWNNGSNIYYSEDDLNADPSFLAFLGKGNNVDIAGQTGNDANHWYAAMEGWGGNVDFNDIVVQLESVQPVPEPGTVLLLGIGLIGLAGLGRKKLMKK